MRCHMHTRLAVLALFLVAGCTAGSSGRYVVSFRTDAGYHRETLPYPPAEVWRHLPEAYTALGLPGGTTTNGNGHEYMTPYLQVQGQLFGRRNSDFITCADGAAGAPLADRARVTLAMITRLEANRTGDTDVLTQIDAYAHRRESSTNHVYCNTTGLLERTVVEMLTRMLRQANEA
jgi:hypothetical protein